MITNINGENLNLINKLRKLKMSAFADELEKQLEDPNIDLKSFDERITDLINAEWDLRLNKKINRYMKEAQLRYPTATFDETIYEPSRKLAVEVIDRLATLEWIDQKKNLLITGKSSTGKSYLASAFGCAAVHRFKHVRYVKANHLLMELETAHVKGEYIDAMKKLSQLDLVIIDDFGLMDLDIDKCRNMFEVLDSREGRGSIIVVSQLPISSWYDLFKNNTYADACMERLVHNAYRIEMNGKNMRDSN